MTVALHAAEQAFELLSDLYTDVHKYLAPDEDEVWVSNLVEAGIRCAHLAALEGDVRSAEYWADWVASVVTD